MVTAAAGAAIGFASAPVRSPAGHAEPFEVTERRLEPLLACVPITRVYDATPLDRLGLPVWAAVTPLARDLTVHAGKGVCAQAARISAVMEAIERVSAERVDAGKVVRASYRALAREAGDHAVLDPELFDLPFETEYTPDLACSWVRGRDLLGGGEVWVAADLVTSPAREGICVGVETNGLAAGNLAVEAVLHGLYEIIERDAAARHHFLRRYGEGDQIPPLRIVSLEGLPAPAADWAGAVRAAGLDVTLVELTHDIGVPVFRATLSDSGFPGSEGRTVSFDGLGCDLDPVHALVRAISEAVQSHTAVLVGARDDFEGGTRDRISASRFIDWLVAPSAVEPFVARAAVPGDLLDRLRVVLGGLRAAGFAHCVAVELTRPDLGVPVVRVLLPGAAGPPGDTARRPPLRLLRELV